MSASPDLHWLLVAPVVVLIFLMTPIAFVVGALIWAAGLFLIEAWLRRRPIPGLFERVVLRQPSIADEAEGWLRQRL